MSSDHRSSSTETRQCRTFFLPSIAKCYTELQTKIVECFAKVFLSDSLVQN